MIKLREDFMFTKLPQEKEKDAEHKLKKEVIVKEPVSIDSKVETDFQIT